MLVFVFNNLNISNLNCLHAPVRYDLYYYNINILFKGPPFILLNKECYYSKIGLLIVKYGTYMATL